VALKTTAAPTPHQGVPPAPRLRRRTYLTSWRRKLVAGAVVAGALGFLLFEGLNNATVYFKTADQAVADRGSLGTSQFRIEGTVEPGVHQSGSTTLFSIVANGVSVAVIDSAQPPQLFKVGIPVVLEGHWQGNVYAADQIMVKHSASYTEAHPDRLKSQLPQTPTTVAP
jgi:cytochrome c-type biogenesis protein CcmE